MNINKMKLMKVLWQTEKKKYFHKNTKVIFLIFMAKDCEFITEVFKGKNLKTLILETLMVTWFLACWIFSAKLHLLIISIESTSGRPMLVFWQPMPISWKAGWPMADIILFNVN